MQRAKNQHGVLLIIYLKLLGAALFWGGSFVAGRIVVQSVTPCTASFLRYVIASICLVLIVRRTEGGLPALSRRSLLSVILLGLTGIFAYNILFFVGLRTVPAGRAGAIVAATPVVIALCGMLFFKERLTWLKAGGILLAVTGALTVVSRGDYRSLVTDSVSSGDLCILGCAASWVIYSILGKQVMNVMSPLSAVTWSCIVGTVFLFVPAVIEGMFRSIIDIAPLGWAAIVYLGLCATVISFIWYYDGIKEIGLAKAGVFINFVPVFAIICGYIFLHESVGLPLIAGAACTITGAYLTNRKIA